MIGIIFTSIALMIVIYAIVKRHAIAVTYTLLQLKGVCNKYFVQTLIDMQFSFRYIIKILNKIEEKGKEEEIDKDMFVVDADIPNEWSLINQKDIKYKPDSYYLIKYVNFIQAIKHRVQEKFKHKEDSFTNSAAQIFTAIVYKAVDKLVEHNISFIQSFGLRFKNPESIDLDIEVNMDQLSDNYNSVNRIQDMFKFIKTVTNVILGFTLFIIFTTVLYYYSTENAIAFPLGFSSEGIILISKNQTELLIHYFELAFAISVIILTYTCTPLFRTFSKKLIKSMTDSYFEYVLSDESGLDEEIVGAIGDKFEQDEEYFRQVDNDEVEAPLMELPGFQEVFLMEVNNNDIINKTSRNIGISAVFMGILLVNLLMYYIYTL